MVKLADQVVALVLTRTRVTSADLSRIAGLIAEERGAVERVIENVPEFVSAFETPAAAALYARANRSADSAMSAMKARYGSVCIIDVAGSSR